MKRQHGFLVLLFLSVSVLVQPSIAKEFVSEQLWGLGEVYDASYSPDGDWIVTVLDSLNWINSIRSNWSVVPI